MLRAYSAFFGLTVLGLLSGFSQSAVAQSKVKPIFIGKNKEINLKTNRKAISKWKLGPTGTQKLKLNFKGVKAQTVPFAMSLFGGWPLVRGDTEMDTDGRDQVPVEVITKLYHNSRSVYLTVYFKCEEYGGNHTTFQGTRGFWIYTAPANKKIVAIYAYGGAVKRFSAVSIGRNHLPRNFNTRYTFWRNLQYRVDSNGRRDDLVVGVGGEGVFTVYLADR